MLNLIHIHSFITLASELHFGRAAHRLNMTQPPLTRQIKTLEGNLGVVLFKRTSQAVSLTPAGRNLLPEAQALLQQAAEFEGKARVDKNQEIGEVRIGFYGASSYYILPKLLSHARARYPKIRIILNELSAIQQVSAFSLGQIDLGIARPTETPAEIAVYPAFKEKLCLAMPRDAVLGRRQRIRLNDLEGLDFIGYQNSAPYLNGLITKLLKENRISPNIVQQASHAQAIMSLVSANIGVAILPETTKFASFDEVIFRTISDLGKNIAQSNVLVLRNRETPSTKHIRLLCLELFKGI